MTLQIRMGRAASRLQSTAARLAISFAACVLIAGEALAAETPADLPAPIARAAEDGPALWVVRDADSTLYLYGTVHLLKPGTPWGSDKVDAAFDSASEVWFEIVDPNDQTAIMPLIQQYGLSPDQPLSSWLTPDEHAAMAQAARSVGMDPHQIDAFRPWFAAMMIAMGPLNTAGYDLTAGVELNLRARALAAGKPIRGFETIDQQIGGLARMSEEGQRTYLRYYLGTWETAAADLDHAVAGWIAGDETVIAEFAHSNGRAISEETHQIFLAQRNADWADQIETLLQGSGTAFIAIGAAHLAGDDTACDP